MRKTKEQFYEEGAVFRLGKASILREGKDLSIITCGTICIKEALKAADALGAEGIQTKIIDMFTIKPLDREAVIKAATGTRAVITLENHNILNGLGSAVAEVIAEEGISIPLGAWRPDTAGEVGTVDYLLHRFGMMPRP
mgnify:CR=1 FL=1